MAVRDGVDERVEVEGGQVGVLRLDEDHVGSVVPVGLRLLLLLEMLEDNNG